MQASSAAWGSRAGGKLYVAGDACEPRHQRARDTSRFGHRLIGLEGADRAHGLWPELAGCASRTVSRLAQGGLHRADDVGRLVALAVRSDGPALAAAVAHDDRFQETLA